MDNITAYERMRGMHVSIGKKHNVFKGRSSSRFHSDLFIDVKRIVTSESVEGEGEMVLFDSDVFLPDRALRSVEL